VEPKAPLIAIADLHGRRQRTCAADSPSQPIISPNEYRNFHFPHTRIVLSSNLMPSEQDLPPAAVDHVSFMLTLAKRKHEEAMDMVGTPDAKALPRLRQVLQLLEEVEVLAQDAASYVNSDAMAAALKELHQQQTSIALAIERMENLPKPSPWASSWLWMVLVMLAVAVSAVAAC
jgi:hypothetical protein